MFLGDEDATRLEVVGVHPAAQRLSVRRWTVRGLTAASYSRWRGCLLASHSVDLQPITIAIAEMPIGIDRAR